MNHMRKILAFFCAITLVMSMSAFASEAPDTAGETRILVLETSDIHGWIMDASSGAESTFQYRGAYLAHIVNEARASDAYDDVLLLDGGDLYQGCPVSNLLTGAPVRAFVDAMDYDAVSLSADHRVVSPLQNGFIRHPDILIQFDCHGILSLAAGFT